MSTKIFVIYHKEEDVLNQDPFQPIAVGSGSNEFNEAFLRDNTGDNIANLNPIYNEMTAIYWVYRHLDAFQDLDHIGFCHYRRLFCFQNFSKPIFVRKRIVGEWVETSQAQLDSFWKEFDAIVPCRNHVRSVRRHYEKAHNKEDLYVIDDIIAQTCPQYLGAYRTYIEGDEEYLYNMFIMSKKDFLAYGDFIFTVLDLFAKKRPYKEERLFISERLTGAFIRYLIDQDEHVLESPLLLVRSRSLKAAFRQTKENFKLHPEYGFLFKTKPIWLTLLPRWFEQRLRNRTRII